MIGMVMSSSSNGSGTRPRSTACCSSGAAHADARSQVPPSAKNVKRESERPTIDADFKEATEGEEVGGRLLRSTVSCSLWVRRLGCPDRASDALVHHGFRGSLDRSLVAPLLLHHGCKDKLENQQLADLGVSVASRQR